MKSYNLGIVKMEMETNGFPKGFKLKRELSVRECRYIMYTLLGIRIKNKEDFYYGREEYDDYNYELKNNVNDWLCGKFDDCVIMDYADDCSDYPLGLKNFIPIIAYLKKRKVID